MLTARCMCVKKHVVSKAEPCLQCRLFGYETETPLQQTMGHHWNVDGGTIRESALMVYNEVGPVTDS